MVKSYILATALAFFITGCISSIEEGEKNHPVKGTEYMCENGMKLSAVYFTTGDNGRYARIQFEETEYVLKNVPSGSGAKYSDGKNIWWTKGTSGFLEIDSVIRLRSCVSQGQK